MKITLSHYVFFLNICLIKGPYIMVNNYRQYISDRILCVFISAQVILFNIKMCIAYINECPSGGSDFMYPWLI